MTRDEMFKILSPENYNDECKRFDRVLVKRHPMPEIHALLLLAELDPTAENVLGQSFNGEIWLGFNPDVVNKSITIEQALELRRCGVSLTDTGIELRRHEIPDQPASVAQKLAADKFCFCRFCTIMENHRCSLNQVAVKP